MTVICRTCLEEIENDSVTFCLNSADFKVSLGNKLTYCIPEMDLDIVPNAVICNTCFESLTLAHEFKRKCLKTEGRIQSYIEQAGYVVTCINLRDIAQQKCEENLDMKNLQCDTKHFFDVPKIAQLLAEDSVQADSCIHKCNKCDYRAPKRQTLILHMRKHSEEESKRKSNLDKKRRKVYKCAFCHYVSAHRKSLDSHLHMHLKTKVYACTLCQYNTSSKLNFLRHVTMHNVLCCSHCGYETTKKSDLKAHMQLHLFDCNNFGGACIDEANVAVNHVT
ncbi:hypothetical protein FQR65_LT14474 [Abscondita terminalis]|nr:hypothetical protein FQR65_LT14474 [Abscondita terminalis]